MNKNITDIYNLIQDLSWHFGSHSFSGECCRDLSLAEFMALKKIQECINISVQEIGNSLGFTKSGASKIVDRLEHKGYAVRDSSSTDGRVCCVNITVKGNDTLISIIDEYSAYVDEMLKEYNPAMLDRIKNDLELLTASAQQHQQALIQKE